MLQERRRLSYKHCKLSTAWYGDICSTSKLIFPTAATDKVSLSELLCCASASEFRQKAIDTNVEQEIEAPILLSPFSQDFSFTTELNSARQEPA